jgi:hypothetical protein
MKSDSEKNEIGFELNLLFEGHKQPIEAFTELGKIFEALYEFYKWMLNHISREASFYLNLENLEYSSIKTWIAQILRSIPDDAIEDLSIRKLFGSFLLKAKYLFLKKLDIFERDLQCYQ